MPGQNSENVQKHATEDLEHEHVYAQTHHHDGVAKYVLELTKKLNHAKSKTVQLTEDHHHGQGMVLAARPVVKEHKPVHVHVLILLPSLAVNNATRSYHTQDHAKLSHVQLMAYGDRGVHLVDVASHVAVVLWNVSEHVIIHRHNSAVKLVLVQRDQ